MYVINLWTMAVNTFSQDLEKLKTIASDRQSLFLFNSLSTHYQKLALLDVTLITAQSSAILDDLIVALRAPGVHRAQRNLLGRCFITTFHRTGKSPFETINKILNLLHREREEKFRWNATVVLGSIFENVGDQVVSIYGELVATMAKLMKSSSNSPGIRSAVLNTIASALSVTTKLDEAIQKEVTRLLRLYLSDKSIAIQRAAYNVRGCLQIRSS